MACSCLRLPATAAAAATAALPTSSPSSSQIVATIPLHYSTKSKARSRASDLSAAFRLECRSSFLGTRPAGLNRSQSLEIGNGGRKKTKQALRRAISADLQSFDEAEEEDIVKRLERLLPIGKNGSMASENQESIPSTSSYSDTNQPWQPRGFKPSDWPGGQAIAVPPSMTTNSCDLPVSLQILKQKKKKQKMANWEESIREAGESARCSVDKAFSSMVFMIRELQSYTLYMRQALFYDDNIQALLGRVQQEMHASFVWLFQQIFSCTPTLMVLVMLLLANFTVYSISSPVVSAAPLPPPQVEMVDVAEGNYEHEIKQPRFDQDPSVGGSSGGGGGGKVRLVAGSTGDGRSEGPSSSQRITHAGTPSRVTVDGEADKVRDEEEKAVWNLMVQEAKEMQANLRDESLMDPNVLKKLVAPVSVKVEHDAYLNYVITELLYEQAVKQDPENSLLLSNFAQFLQLVLHDNERAEYYYKKAVEIKPTDAEALSKYATFLWLVKNDIGGAEENYQEAIAADPGNSYHAAAYAHFLWNTGGEDTCFPAYGA